MRVDLTYSLPTGGAQAGSYSSMCLLDAVLYWMIFLYLEAVYPGEQGVPRRWYFIFTLPYRYFFPSHGQKTSLPTLKALQLEEDTLGNFERSAPMVFHFYLAVPLFLSFSRKQTIIGHTQTSSIGRPRYTRQLRACCPRCGLCS